MKGRNIFYITGEIKSPQKAISEKIYTFQAINISLNVNNNNNNYYYYYYY